MDKKTLEELSTTELMEVIRNLSVEDKEAKELLLTLCGAVEKLEKDKNERKKQFAANEKQAMAIVRSLLGWSALFGFAGFVAAVFWPSYILGLLSMLLFLPSLMLFVQTKPTKKELVK